MPARNAAAMRDDDCDNEDRLLYADEGSREVLSCSKEDTLASFLVDDFEPDVANSGFSCGLKGSRSYFPMRNPRNPQKKVRIEFHKVAKAIPLPKM